jgi:arylformamidase
VSAAAGSGGWIDASVPVRDGMVHWPTDPPVRLSLHDSIERGDPANVTELHCSAHLGTHMDAPVHFIPDGAGIEALSLDAMIGPARVLQIEDPKLVRGDELAGHGLAAGERVLLRTRNSESRWWEEDFHEDFVGVAPDAARLIAEAGVALVGVDYISVGDAETHRELLGAGVVVVEGLDLTQTQPGEYELICLPAKLAGADGAPVRALLRGVQDG